MTTMQARPRFITILLALSATAIVAGCGDDHAEDPLAAVAADYRQALSQRSTIREQSDAADDTAEALRQLATRAQSAGRDGDKKAAAILVSGIRETAATYEYDEAMRAESRADTLRGLVRGMAADADLLAAAADAAASLDLGDTNLLLEGQLASARQRLDEAQAELEALQSQTASAEATRNERLAEAMSLDERAREQDEAAAATPSAIDQLDLLNAASHWREQSHQRRIEAAREDISILTIAPTMVLADARRDGASDTVDTAREAREAAESSVAEVRAYADDVRGLLDDLRAGAADSIARIEAIENDLVMPRLEASIADFEAAAAAARPLTQGGREDAAAGWRAVANAQFGAGRGHWEVATIQGRRADLFSRLAANGVLADSSAAARAAAEANDARTNALQAAEAAFNEAIGSLASLQADEVATRTRVAIEAAIAGVKGEAMMPVTAPSGGRGGAAPAGGGTAASTGNGVGFGSPAEAANFLSDDSNALSPAAFNRMKSAMRATTASGKSVEKILNAAGLIMPLIEALSDQFGEQAVTAAFADGGVPAMGGMAMSMSATFGVDSVDGDTATLKSSDGSQSLVLTRTPGGWMVDLDATVEADPQMKMMVQFLGATIEQQMAPMRTAIDGLAARIAAGEFDSLDDAMSAIEETMAAAQPKAGGLPGGF